MRIAILSRRPSLYSTTRLKEAGKNRGHDMSVVDYLRCYMDITAHRPAVKLRGQSLSFDAVVPRIGASNTFYGAAVVRQLEMMGVFAANGSEVAPGRSVGKQPELTPRQIEELRALGYVAGGG